MTSGDEGFLTLTVRVRVGPEPEVVELLKRYRNALNYAIEWIVKHSTRVGKKYRVPSLKEIHGNLYDKLKRYFGLPSRIALDCYREALSIAKSYLGNGAKGKIPKAKTLRMWLSYGVGYRVKNGYVEIIGGHRLRIEGWDRRYDGFESREARLVYRDGKMFLMITKRVPKPNPIKPRGVVAVDVNESRIAYGNKNEVRFVETAIDRAYRYAVLAQRLQEKYSSTRYMAWLRRRGILNRVRSHYRKARSILIDWARRTALEIVRYALRRESAIALEDLTNLIESLRKLSRNHRTKLIVMGYRRLHYWLKWQAEKHGIPVVVVEPKGTSTMCPRCGSRMISNGYRRLRCQNCDFEEDRDVVAVLNIERRALFEMEGALIPLTAPQMTDVNPNRCGEPMNRPKGTPRPEGRGGGQLKNLLVYLNTIF